MSLYINLALKEDQGLTSSQAWRVAFIVPFILITATFLGMLFLCEDTPTGKWSERHNAVRHLLETHGVDPAVEQSEKSGADTPQSTDKVEPNNDVEAGSRCGSVKPSASKEAPILIVKVSNTT